MYKVVSVLQGAVCDMYKGQDLHMRTRFSCKGARTMSL